ncbi:jacalin-like lectin [Anaerolentibacter hominis]|uniref:jacalin-like lectin n=1 Tax=Anaerolentibacter hominis TaxID=3079009 RepID=UPI0031B89F6D
MEFNIKVRYMDGAENGSRYRYEPEQIDGSKVGVIVSDMWDRHWCRGATRRVNELAGPMNRVLIKLRELGASIAFCPSRVAGSYYGESPARMRTLGYPAGRPREVRDLSGIPAVTELIDPYRVQCDCSPKCEMGRVWVRQHEALFIDQDQDFICDDSREGDAEFCILNAFLAKGITHVIVMGVHTNMCVIHRNFGMRELYRAGFTPIVMRDMTDCMIPREEKPYHDHFTALDDTISYIETWLGGSITSDQILGDEPFHFAEDTRRSRLYGSRTERTEDLFADRGVYQMPPVSGLTLCTGDRRISGIRLSYGKEKTRWIGSGEGARTEASLSFGEYIAGVDGWTEEERVVGLGVRTSTGAYMRAGCTDGEPSFTWQAENGFALTGMYACVRPGEMIISGLGFYQNYQMYFESYLEDENIRQLDTVFTFENWEGEECLALCRDGVFTYYNRNQDSGQCKCTAALPVMTADREKGLCKTELKMDGGRFLADGGQTDSVLLARQGKCCRLKPAVLHGE